MPCRTCVPSLAVLGLLIGVCEANEGVLRRQTEVVVPFPAAIGAIYDAHFEVPTFNVLGGSRLLTGVRIEGDFTLPMNLHLQNEGPADPDARLALDLLTEINASFLAPGFNTERLDLGTFEVPDGFSTLPLQVIDNDAIELPPSNVFVGVQDTLAINLMAAVDYNAIRADNPNIFGGPGFEEPGPAGVLSLSVVYFFEHGPCLCEVDGNPHALDIHDLLVYLDVFFRGEPAADLNCDFNAVNPWNVTIEDLLIFLECWFDGLVLGCPA